MACVPAGKLLWCLPPPPPPAALVPPALPRPLQITTRSKLSSVSWNSYVKSQLITSDYSGLIQLWDASTAGEVAQFDEHARRVWSVDFSAADPMKFLRWEAVCICMCLWESRRARRVADVPACLLVLRFMPPGALAACLGLPGRARRRCTLASPVVVEVGGFWLAEQGGSCLPSSLPGLEHPHPHPPPLCTAAALTTAVCVCGA